MFVVVPLIEESEQLENVKSAYQTFEEFEWIYTDWKVGLLHGKMKPAEKQEVMRKFKVGEYHILISTTVIEVWIDIPQATLMIIMNSERFGLSQLHQLRWRVGRNDLQSYCFLHTKNKSTSDRLKAMEETTDGFKLAEIDLKLRWPGELLGIRQSGEADLPLEALSDPLFIEKAQSCAHHILEKGEEYTNNLMSKLGEWHVYSVS
jgi:ATP-dependent DNA helicase RecG